MEDQRPYWERVAARKTFTHPLDRGWLDAYVPATARVLDYGCGYGRTMAELCARGYRRLVGMDFSAAMIARGRRDHPDLDLRVVRSLPTVEPDGSFDAAFLMAVLTAIPEDAEQDAVMAELRRLLRPGGILYVSDMPLQTDDRNRARYLRDAGRFGAHGVFRTDDGALVRHHDEARLLALLDGFVPLGRQEIALTTMNGNAATGVQIIARKGGAAA
ncbi:MAG: class I SAM-dependent methyltransferase [Alphaproteobacteria bacterium]